MKKVINIALFFKIFAMTCILATSLYGAKKENQSDVSTSSSSSSGLDDSKLLNKSDLLDRKKIKIPFKTIELRRMCDIYQAESKKESTLGHLSAPCEGCSPYVYSEDFQKMMFAYLQEFHFDNKAQAILLHTMLFNNSLCCWHKQKIMFKNIRLKALNFILDFALQLVASRVMVNEFWGEQFSDTPSDFLKFTEKDFSGLSLKIEECVQRGKKSVKPFLILDLKEIKTMHEKIATKKSLKQTDKADNLDQEVLIGRLLVTLESFLTGWQSSG